MTTSSDKKQRVTLFLHASLLIQARAQAVVDKQSLTGLVEKALNKYLPRQTVIKKAYIRA